MPPKLVNQVSCMAGRDRLFFPCARVFPSALFFLFSDKIRRFLVGSYKKSRANVLRVKLKAGRDS